ncbi:fumarylacetoacetate hydrolase family protein [Amycolatopsis sp. H20-H5]|uniref:fumarylacetoacetate hydrolase family protein n=1 Tax=Amycolatopsis sp. H20-H5 TaxID=3046309 RepID=UPI002DB7A1B9|nr:fumarylacetoacetate hydrolase family protein [Amycolatopsis sp. H20-H5]MEC3975746.1 fumarylacetoacetate hydrolase family protein [Amycolatopsis sp. H20-H5]
MTRYVSTTRGVGRFLADDTVELLDIAEPDLGAVLRAGRTLGELAAAGTRDKIAPAEVELLPAIPRPSKIWAVGFGYHDHRAETGHSAEVGEPTIFMKAPSSVTASGAPIRFPAVAPDEVDYEGELAIVIGQRLTSVDEQAAWDGIAGFTIANDVSARDVQKGRIEGRPADVSAAKSFDTFTPLGPALATLDGFADPNDLSLRTWVDDELRQDARTSDLIYPAKVIVAYLSRQTTLEPGDVIMTGTPAGVGHKQGKFLRSGQTVRIAIEGIGELVNTCA